MSKEKEDIECVEAERGKSRKEVAPPSHLWEAEGQASTCCVSPRLFTHVLSSLCLAAKNKDKERGQSPEPVVKGMQGL